LRQAVPRRMARAALFLRCKGISEGYPASVW
jgi:hypothetical protein